MSPEHLAEAIDRNLAIVQRCLARIEADEDSTGSDAYNACGALGALERLFNAARNTGANAALERHGAYADARQRAAQHIPGLAPTRDNEEPAADDGSGPMALPDDLRKRFESSLGADLQDVRVHTDASAEAGAQAVGAHAYTVGRDIYFGAGNYDPGSRRGQALIAHEVAHVVQQPAGGQHGAAIDGGASDPHERHADAVADAIVRGESAGALLDARPPGSGAWLQRKTGEVDTSQLPDDKNFLVLTDGSVLVRTSWLLSDPEKQSTAEGELAIPQRMSEILTALRASHLTWIDPGQIPELSRKVGIAGGVDPNIKFGHYQIAFSIYRLIGPPPNVDVVVTRSGTGLAIMLRQSVAVPGTIDATKRVELSAAVRDVIVAALERHTNLGADPSIKNTIINGKVHWPVTVDPAVKAVYIPFTQHAMEQLFGAKAWQAYLKRPQKEAGSGVITATEGGLERPPQWLPKGTLELTPKLEQYVTGASVEVELAWDLGVHPKAGMVLLPNHCSYAWTVKRNGKVVDSDGKAWILDNRTTSLKLDGEPGTFEVSVVATSEHFLSPEHTFRAHVTLSAIDEKSADKKAFDKAATGKNGPFARGRRGELELKPGQHALTSDQELQSLALTEGAIAELQKQGKLTETDYKVLVAELEKQRATLDEVKKKTASGVPYIVRGSFVNREDSTSLQLKLLMHFMDRGTTNGQGHYSVLLHDTTFGTVTQHPGSAEGTVTKDSNAAYQNVEIKALEDMADHFHAHNDYPSGTVHLAAQPLNGGKVWETTRDTDNGRKTAKKILGGIAMVGGVALLFIPGGGFVSAAVFSVTAAAGVAAVAVEIEDRVAKEGELKFDRRLALDVLQVVSVALPFGRLTRVLAEATTMTKVGYLLTMTGVDVAQGFLIGADVRDQLQLIEANTAYALAQATTDDQKKQILADRDRKVAQIVGGAMVNGGFILVSIGGGIKPIAATLRGGAHIFVREPIFKIAGEGPGAIETTLNRGWFEHVNAKGETERVVLTAEERRYLEQEVLVKSGAGGGTPLTTQDPATEWVAALKTRIGDTGELALQKALESKGAKGLMDQFHGDLDVASKHFAPDRKPLQLPDTIDMFGVGSVPKDPNAKWTFKDKPENWSPDRRALHDQLISTAKADAQKFADAAQSGQPTLFAMRGNTATGKTRAVAGSVPELAGPMAKTKGANYRAVNPDAFKPDLMKATPGGATSSQVHAESSMLATRLETELLNLKTSDGKELGSILIDKRLANLDDVLHYAKLAKESGRKFELFDVDAPLEVSLAGVLERKPGGNDPLPPFDVVSKGFEAVRGNRKPVIDLFLKNPSLGEYHLFATKPNGERVPAAGVKDGTLSIKEPNLYADAIAGPQDIPQVLANRRITPESLEELTAGLDPTRAAEVKGVLNKYLGWTWKAALDAHSVERAQAPPGGTGL